MAKHLSATEVRKLRDKVYGKPISDHEWEICGLNWTLPENVQWLLDASPFRDAGLPGWPNKTL